MFLKQEKPEKDNFERRKNFGFKGKISIILKILTYTLAKSPQNIFAYSFVPKHSKHFFFILRKKNFFGGGGRSPPPYLADASATKCKYFGLLPK